mgnify:CR=1
LDLSGTGKKRPVPHFHSISNRRLPAVPSSVLDPLYEDPKDMNHVPMYSQPDISKKNTHAGSSIAEAMYAIADSE